MNKLLEIMAIGQLAQSAVSVSPLVTKRFSYAVELRVETVQGMDVQMLRTQYGSDGSYDAELVLETSALIETAKELGLSEFGVAELFGDASQIAVSASAVSDKALAKLQDRTTPSPTSDGVDRVRDPSWVVLSSTRPQGRAFLFDEADAHNWICLGVSSARCYSVDAGTYQVMDDFALLELSLSLDQMGLLLRSQGVPVPATLSRVGGLVIGLDEMISETKEVSAQAKAKVTDLVDSLLAEKIQAVHDALVTHKKQLVGTTKALDARNAVLTAVQALNAALAEANPKVCEAMQEGVATLKQANGDRLLGRIKEAGGVLGVDMTETLQLLQ